MRVLLPLLSIPVLFVSCASDPSYGDRLISQGEGTRATGEQWNKGSALIIEGEKQKKKGRKMVSEGEDLIGKGDRNIERGKELKARAEESDS